MKNLLIVHVFVMEPQSLEWQSSATHAESFLGLLKSYRWRCIVGS